MAEPKGCPTTGACSCPNDAAYHAGAEAMRAAIIRAIDREAEYWDKRFGHGMLTYAEGLRIASKEAENIPAPTP